MKRGGSRGKKSRGRLVICGAGLFPARDMTAGAVAGLAGCRSVLYQHSDFARVRDELLALDPRIKLRPFKPGAGGVRLLWLALKAELEAGHDTGYLTSGNPMLRGEGLELSEWCAGEDFPVSVFPGISSLDALLCTPGVTAQALGRGYSVVFAADAAAGGWKPEPLANLVIMGATEELDRRSFLRLHRTLLRALGPGRQVVCAKAADAQSAGGMSYCTLAGLPAIFETLPEKTTLLLPRLRADRLDARSGAGRQRRECAVDGVPSAGRKRSRAGK